ncbi:efflux RND transporter periplasmic adaptor subunit [Paenibacillus senegalensis]|uniref:efflux RND transporter periplasmic adaptor subunit n=1 Tax=Paenibacillus senegalensis TaxID=1465766 RepID=UPI000287F754|nr:biotin/lipoyl-binding protein [Paenibacillus senegalensis]
MELQQSEQALSSRKKYLRVIFSLFAGLLIVFTLFSNTLLTMTLPKVATVQPRPGHIEYHYTGSGVVRPREVVDLTQLEGWKVEKVHVQEGDLVSKGQTLVSYDSSEEEWQVKLENANLMKMKMRMEELQHEYIEVAKTGDPSKMQSAKAAIESYKMDLEIQEQRIQMMQERLASNREMVAPVDGLVKKLNAKEGLSGTGGGPDIQLYNVSQGFEFELQLPTDIADMLKVGEKLVVEIKGTSANQVEGEIVEIENSSVASEGNDYQGEHQGSGMAANPSVKTVLVTLQDNTLQGGEQAQVDLNMKSASGSEMLLVSNLAIREDPSGQYVYTISERSGPLGNAFYVNKTYITVTEANDKESAVQGVFNQSQIVIESSHPLQEGDRVRM